jgi:hypothetical protein
VTSSLIGELPVGVRAGTREGREASLDFVRPGDPPRRAVPSTEFGFDDFIDLINPLQHLPIVSTLYRAWTGDTIEGPARILGDALYGGPIGLAMGVLNAIVEDASGEDIGATLYAAVFGDGDTKAGPTPVSNVAQASSSAPTGLPPVGAAPIVAALPALPAEPVQRAIAQPEAPVAITGYQEALDAMSLALDRYQARKLPIPTVDASY